MQTCTGFIFCGSVVECLNRDRGAAGSSLTGVPVLCPGARHIDPSLVLVQHRKICPFITERLLMGRKESNQTILCKFNVVVNLKHSRFVATANFPIYF